MPLVIHELVTLFGSDFRKWLRISSIIDHHLYFPLWKYLKPALTALLSLQSAGCMGLTDIRKTPRVRFLGIVLTKLYLSHV